MTISPLTKQERTAALLTHLLTTRPAPFTCAYTPVNDRPDKRATRLVLATPTPHIDTYAINTALADTDTHPVAITTTPTTTGDYQFTAYTADTGDPLVLPDRVHALLERAAVNLWKTIAPVVYRQPGDNEPTIPLPLGVQLPEGSPYTMTPGQPPSQNDQASSTPIRLTPNDPADGLTAIQLTVTSEPASLPEPSEGDADKVRQYLQELLAHTPIPVQVHYTKPDPGKRRYTRDRIDLDGPIQTMLTQRYDDYQGTIAFTFAANALGAITEVACAHTHDGTTRPVPLDTPIAGDLIAAVNLARNVAPNRLRTKTDGQARATATITKRLERHEGEGWIIKPTASDTTFASNTRYVAAWREDEWTWTLVPTQTQHPWINLTLVLDGYLDPVPGELSTPQTRHPTRIGVSSLRCDLGQPVGPADVAPLPKP